MRTLLIICALLSLYGCKSDASSSIDNKKFVKVFKLSTIDSIIQSKEYTIIYFWAPWCTASTNTFEHTIKPIIDTLDKSHLSVLNIAVSKDINETESILTEKSIFENTFIISDYLVSTSLTDKMKINSTISDMFPKSDIPFINSVPVFIITNKNKQILYNSYDAQDLFDFLDDIN